MDTKRRIAVCAWVYADQQYLERVALKEEFSKFGNVRKIFIDNDLSYAKVYFDDTESVQRACAALKGNERNWEVRLRKDNYWNGSAPSNSRISQGTDLDNSSLSGASNLEEMEEECTNAGEYVDVHGKDVEVLQAENGQLFVNLDDVRTAGFNIYPKESFANASIPKDVEMRHFENYLLNQGKQYIINYKQSFNEHEMLNVFERVRAKLQITETTPSFGEGRMINNTNSKNFSITARTNASPPVQPRGGGFPNANSRSPKQLNSRPPKQLPPNCQPSTNSFNNRNTRNSLDNRQPNRQYRQPPSGDYTSPQNNFRNTHQRSEGGFRDKNHGFNSNAEYRQPKPMLKNEEPEEQSWDGEQAAAVSTPKPRAPQAAAVSPPKPRASQADSGPVTKERNLLNVERVQLEVGSNYKVRVSYLKPEKNGLFYGQKLESASLMEEILLHVNTQDNELPEINQPERHMLCIAFFEDCWYRAVVLHGRDTPGHALVELMDYGNKEEITVPVREMSEAMKKIPAQAIRCAIHAGSEGNCDKIEIDQVLEVFVKKRYDDFTHVVELKNVEQTPNVEPVTRASGSTSDVDQLNVSKPEPAPEEEDCFTEIQPNTVKIAPGESVLILDFNETTLKLRNKDTASICKKVYARVQQMDKKPISNPKVGQLVLCSSEAGEGLHRAVIRKVDDKVAVLEFIDFCAEDTTLSLKSLRNADKELVSYPSSIIELDYPALSELTANSLEFLNRLIIEKIKVKATLVDDRMDFVLTEGDKTTLLSDKIKELAKPAQAAPEPEVKSAAAESSASAEVPPKQQPTKSETPPQAAPEPEVKSAPTQPETSAPVAAAAAQPAQVENDEEFIRITFDDMPYVRAQLGKGLYGCYACTDGFVTLVSLAPENEDYLIQLTPIEPKDQTAHAPEPYEMCLAKYEDTWYRALAVDEVSGSPGVFHVVFVDYGNSEHVHKDNLRRFPKRLSTIPIIGINAYFQGIPNATKIHDRIKELISEEEPYEVDVKADTLSENMKYAIEIPSVYETLRKEGLI